MSLHHCVLSVDTHRYLPPRPRHELIDLAILRPNGEHLRGHKLLQLSEGRSLRTRGATTTSLCPCNTRSQTPESTFHTRSCLSCDPETTR
jgi:hypothetical protein